MTATSPCSKAGRSQAEKKIVGTVWKKTTTGPDAELVMKGKPLHALKFFLHVAYKAKEKRLCASWSQCTKM